MIIASVATFGLIICHKSYTETFMSSKLQYVLCVTMISKLLPFTHKATPKGENMVD